MIGNAVGIWKKYKYCSYSIMSSLSLSIPCITCILNHKVVKSLPYKVVKGAITLDLEQEVLQEAPARVRMLFNQSKVSRCVLLKRSLPKMMHIFLQR